MCQQRDMTGVVKESRTGVPLAGATLLLGKTNVSAITNERGEFRIKVPAEKGELIVSYVGYTTQTIMFNKNQNKIVISLEPITNNQLNDVLIIGYGSVKKKDLTGSVSSVDIEDLVKAPVPSFADALAGRVPGIVVTSNDGQPGSQANITIRGIGSLTQSVSPLFVVDGFAMESFDLGTLSPEDISSITVLKDASSTAIYGARGSNGVIVIETKKGKIGKPVIRYNGSIGFNKITKRMEMMSPYEFIKFELDRFPTESKAVYFPNLAPGEKPDPELYRNVAGIDWQDKVLRLGKTQIHNLSLSGGANGTKYITSLSYYDGQGTIINTQYNRVQGRLGLDQTINKKLNAGINANYSYEHSSGIIPSDGIISGSSTSSFFSSVWGYRPVAAPRQSASDSLENQLIDPYLNPTNDFRINPVIMAENEDRNNYNTNFIVNAYLNYTITKNLILTIRGNADRRIRENNYFYNSKTRLGIIRQGISGLGVQGGISFSKYNLISNENYVSYSKTFNTNHQLDIKLGGSWEKISVNNYGLKVQNIPNEELGLSGLDQGIPLSNTSVITESALQSFFGRINYNYRSKYLFTFSFRADGSSKFAPENRWGYFPSGAFAWRMSDEKLIKRLTFISDAKLRVSYGLSGNNRVGDFSYLSSIGLPTSSYYSFNNQTPSRGAAPGNLGNSDLKWETSSQLDIGYDLSLFKSKIVLGVDYYNKKTTDLLLNATLPLISGFSSGFKNIGSIRNEGLEFSLSTINVKRNGFLWQTDFNISFNNNKILSLNQDQPFLLSTVSWDGNYSSTPLYISRVGESASQFWGLVWDGVYQYEDFDQNTNGTYTLKSTIPTNGNARANIYPGDIKYKDLNGDGIVNAQDRTVIGRTLPKHTGGFNNNFSYKGFSLNIFFQWSYGNDIFNANRILFEGGYNVRPFQNQVASYANRWTPTNPSNTMFRASAGSSPSSGAGPNGALSSLTLEDGSYLRLKTIALDYNIPEKFLQKLKISNLSIGAAAQNIYTWTKYSGVDPEVSSRNSILTPGFDFSSYPRAKTIVFSIKATF